MTTKLSIVVRPAVSRWPGLAAQLFGVCCSRIVDYFIRRAAIKTLRELDDRALRDVGLVRAQIVAAVRGLASVPDQGRTS